MPSIFRPMRRSLWFPGLCGIFLLSLLGIRSAHASQPTAGFWQANSSATAMPPLTASQIAQFLPDKRGPFTFPAPYNTTGIRVTQPSDCGGQNCVDYIGYSYWARMSNSTGSNTMWIMVGLEKSKGGTGPTLYKLDKSTDAVTKVGPIFTDDNVNQSGGMMYFSHSKPNALYYIGEGLSTLNRIDVVTHKETQVFNINSYKQGDHIFQCSTDNNDVVSACSLEDSSYNVQGCVVYNGSGFTVFPSAVAGGFDECHISPTGKTLLIDEKTTQTCSNCDEDTVIVDLETGKQTIIDNKIGGGGHYAQGYGYYLQAMNWNLTYGVTKLWNVADLAAGGKDVWDQPYRTQCNYNPTVVCAGGPSHPSWLNAVPASVMPIAKQYVCDSTAHSITLNKPFGHQVWCYYLDASVPLDEQRSLVIAPTMIDTDKTGCSGGAYGQDPKGNIDPTGHYFIWSANLDSNNNCQVFIVKIPTSQLPYPPPAVTPPQINITNPANAATVFGTVAAKAEVSSDIKIASVKWELDGQEIGSSDTAPYTYDLNTNNYSMGSHTLTAVATNTAGNTGTATSNIVITQASPSNNNGSGGGSLTLLSLAALGLFATLGFVRKRG